MNYKSIFRLCSYYCVFSHDVMAAILVSQNNETAAMFVSQTSPVGVSAMIILHFHLQAQFKMN